MVELWETVSELENGVEERAKKHSEVEEQRLLALDQINALGKDEASVQRSLSAARSLQDFAWSLRGLLDSKMAKVQQAAKTLAGMEASFSSKRLKRRDRDLVRDLIHNGGAAISKPTESDEEDIAAAKSAVMDRRHRFASHSQRRKGWDSSSASEDDGVLELQTDRRSFCLAVHKQILSDVSDDFGTIQGLLEPLCAAKSILGEDLYTQAHIPTSLPEALSLHVSFALLWWDPLRVCIPATAPRLTWGPLDAVGTIELEKFSWFQILADFTEHFGEQDPDAELLPALVQTSVFPEVARRIRDCWDVCSLKQTERVAAMLDECLLFDNSGEDCAESQMAFNVLVRAALDSLDRGLARSAPEVFVEMSKIASWNESSARQRLLWRYCKVARCSCLLSEQLPQERLSLFVLCDIFQVRLWPHLCAREPRLHSDDMAIIEEFSKALPQRWFTAGMPSALAPLRDALGPRAPALPAAADTAQAAARVLEQIGCLDEAHVIRAA
jgi:hypothetical protein